MEPIIVEFTFTPESFGKAQMHIMLRYLKNSWLKWALIVALAAYLGAQYYFGGRDIVRLINMLIWVPLFLAVWWVVFKWLSRRNFFKHPMLQYPIRYTFTADEVLVKTHVTEGVIQWAGIPKVEESEHFFLLYQSALLASPLLKMGFKDEAEQEKFRALLRSKQLLS